MTEHSERVVAYITTEGSLLVFTHLDYREAGVQVPGGHPDPGESLEDAVVRESNEETGLKDLELVEYLGYIDLDLRSKGIGLERRHFYHLRYNGPVTEPWIGYEVNPSDGTPAPVRFQFRWVSLSEEIRLDWDHDAYLHKIVH